MRGRNAEKTERIEEAADDNETKDTIPADQHDSYILTFTTVNIQ